MKLPVFLLLLFVDAFSGPGRAYAQDADSQDPFASVEREFDEYEKRAVERQKNEEARVLGDWKEYKDRVLRNWSDGIVPEQKRYVQYDEQGLSRLRVDYEDGAVNVESLQDGNDKDAPEKAKKAILEQLNRVVQEDKGAKLPILDGAGTAVSADQITVQERSEKGRDGVLRKRYTYSFKLDQGRLQKRVDAVLPWVKEWTQKNGVDPSLALAVIKQESAFNARARSWVPAFGLMQIVPAYAGKDVMNHLEKKNVEPSEETLYDPRANILFGTTYLKLLNERFSSIKNATNRLYVVICAYNWGPGRLQKLIRQKKIHPEGDSKALFQALLGLVPNETKGYLTRVSENYEMFKGSNRL